MNYSSISRGLPDSFVDIQHSSVDIQHSSVDIQPDKRWLGTLLCCLSALVMTMSIVLATNFLVSSGDRDIARGDDRTIDSLSPAGRVIHD